MGRALGNFHVGKIVLLEVQVEILTYMGVLALRLSSGFLNTLGLRLTIIIIVFLSLTLGPRLVFLRHRSLPRFLLLGCRGSCRSPRSRSWRILLILEWERLRSFFEGLPVE